MDEVDFSDLPTYKHLLFKTARATASSPMEDLTAARSHAKALLSLVPGNSTVVKVDMDKLLSNVHHDDRVLVSNVIKTMQVLRPHDFLHNMEVVNNKKGYDVIGTLGTSFEKELIVTAADFEILQSVSCTRVASVMVQVSNKALELVVRVYKHDTPMTFSTVQVSHINKKTRWLF
ncbi:hypothetical protein T484DRAFT_1751234 [Baffinella frigidus]|nr:hypothetical protein T484DRAFT_1751234 [Cryptophyta sp. CCMP2293]